MSDIANRRTIDGWRVLAASKLDLSEGDMDLLEALAENIMDRWEARANNGVAPQETMDAIYRSEREVAIGAIIAAVELVQAVGNGGRLPEEYAELVKVKA